MNKSGNIICIACQKGGIGKTTTVFNLGAAMNAAGHKTLLIDLDAQCNLSYSMGADQSLNGMLDLLNGSPAAECIQSTDNGDLIAGSPQLAATEITDLKALKRDLDPLREKYEYILIDTPPSLDGTAILNALSAADHVLIPLEITAFSLQGLQQILGTMQAVMKRINPDLNNLGVLITKYEPKSELTAALWPMILSAADQLGFPVLKSKIRLSRPIPMSQAAQQNIIEYSPRSNGSKDYRALAEEITERTRGN